jgi:TonB family protein
MHVHRIACIVALALAGCASAPEKKAAGAVNDPEALQVVRIHTMGIDGPVAARCGVKNDRGSSEILAPGVAEVIRSAKPLEVLCFAPGYRIAMRSLESAGDVVGPAATGVVAGGAVTAVAALPLLAVPVFGPLMYAGAVGSGALVGGAVNAADKHTQGKIYSYPPSAMITLVPENAPLGSSPQIAAPRPTLAPEAVPVASVQGLNAAPVAAAAPMSLPRSGPPLMPIAHEVPAFPQEAAAITGLFEGRVRARLDIDATGAVTRVQVVEARPEKLFDRAVTETLARWKFPPGLPGRQFETEVEFRR